MPHTYNTWSYQVTNDLSGENIVVKNLRQAFTGCPKNFKLDSQPLV